MNRPGQDHPCFSSDKVLVRSAGYLLATLRALEATDPKVFQTLTNVGMDPGRLLALAFKDLAENTDKIGQLNISPDLLRELMAGK